MFTDPAPPRCLDFTLNSASPERHPQLGGRPSFQSTPFSTIGTGPVATHRDAEAGGPAVDAVNVGSAASGDSNEEARSPHSLGRGGSSMASTDGQAIDTRLEMAVSPGVRGIGRDCVEGASNSTGFVPPKTFMESLHLSKDQLEDFRKNRHHFLYLRQKPGPDANTYNLEVSFINCGLSPGK